MSPPARRTSRAAIGAAAFLLFAVAPIAPAFAHGQKPGGDKGRIEPVLDALPAALAQVRVQIHESLAPQLVVENTAGAPFEVIDELGAPFLRIGPDGVEGNLASHSFYRTASPSDSVPIPEEVTEASAAGRSLPERWRRVAAEPSWGWFDRRIETDELAVPHAVLDGGKRVEIGRWEIPVRLGGATHSLRGGFVFVPKPRGRLQMRLESSADLAPGVRVTLLPGRGGSLFLRSQAEKPVTLFGRDGEPFLRFSPAGVEANLRSPTYALAARLRGGEDLAEPAAGGEEAPRWQRISPSPRHGWVDPRTLLEVSEAVSRGEEAVELGRWVLPVSVGSGDNATPTKIVGSTWWVPLPVRAGQAREIEKE